jgi:hypothetical protein
MSDEYVVMAWTLSGPQWLAADGTLTADKSKARRFGSSRAAREESLKLLRQSDVGSTAVESAD